MEIRDMMAEPMETERVELERVEIKPIGREQAEKAMTLLKKYQDGKKSIDERVKRNEEWYRLRHWGDVGHSKNPSDPETSSAWLLNSLMQRHADAMDNFPEPSVLPREEADKGDAQILSEIIPVILEQMDYEDIYSRKWWRKLKAGVGVTYVGWDSKAENGLGEVQIKLIDVLSLFWEPGVNDIQDSENLFRVDMMNNDQIEAQWPEMKGKLGGGGVTTTRYIADDNQDTSEKTAIIDWYYKRSDLNGRQVLHYAKICNGEVLFASENEPDMRETGYYEHGLYPFVMDVMFPIEDTPVGFGLLDVSKDAQITIDKLNQVILKNAMISCRPRHFVRQDGMVNEEEYADLTKDFIHFRGSGDPKDSILTVNAPQLGAYYMNYLEHKIQELKDTAGNNDFGSTSAGAGVTAASALAALEESGSRLIRDYLKASYRAFREEVSLVIEMIRQFYDVQRTFRIVGEQGMEKYQQYSNANIKPGGMINEYGVETAGRKPVFDIKVKAHKANTFSRLSQNELMKEFYSAGFFQPENATAALACIEGMDFEAKDAVEQRISKNGTLLDIVKQQQQQIAQLMQMAGINMGMGQEQPQQGGGAAAPGQMKQKNIREDGLGGQRSESNAMNAVRDRVLNAGNPAQG